MDSLIVWCVTIWSCVFFGGLIWSEVLHERQQRKSRTQFPRYPLTMDFLQGRADYHAYRSRRDDSDRTFWNCPYDRALDVQAEQHERADCLRTRRRQLRAVK